MVKKIINKKGVVQTQKVKQNQKVVVNINTEKKKRTYKRKTQPQKEKQSENRVIVQQSYAPQQGQQYFPIVPEDNKIGIAIAKALKDHQASQNAKEERAKEKDIEKTAPPQDTNIQTSVDENEPVREAIQPTFVNVPRSDGLGNATHLQHAPVEREHREELHPFRVQMKKPPSIVSMAEIPRENTLLEKPVIDTTLIRVRNPVRSGTTMTFQELQQKLENGETIKLNPFINLPTPYSIPKYPTREEMERIRLSRAQAFEKPKAIGPELPPGFIAGEVKPEEPEEPEEPEVTIDDLNRNARIKRYKSYSREQLVKKAIKKGIDPGPSTQRSNGYKTKQVLLHAIMEKI